MSPRALLLTGLGLNCEDETATALRMAGAQCTELSLHHFLSMQDSRIDDDKGKNKINLKSFDLVVFPGGFSYGDALGSGQVVAHKLRQARSNGEDSRLHQLLQFVRQGGHILGICNGFQILCRSGLLPFADGQQHCSLGRNDSDRFEDRWLQLAAHPQRVLPALANQDIWEFPVRHAEGKLVFAKPEIRARVVEQRLDVLHYIDSEQRPTQHYPENPNGSDLACAALCDPSGHILGMMPHPEAALSFYNHPNWPRRSREMSQQNVVADGTVFFRQFLQNINPVQRLHSEAQSVT